MQASVFSMVTILNAHAMPHHAKKLTCQEIKLAFKSVS